MFEASQRQCVHSVRPVGEVRLPRQCCNRHPSGIVFCFPSLFPTHACAATSSYWTSVLHHTAVSSISCSLIIDKFMQYYDSSTDAPDGVELTKYLTWLPLPASVELLSHERYVHVRDFYIFWSRCRDFDASMLNRNAWIVIAFETLGDG